MRRIALFTDPFPYQGTWYPHSSYGAHFNDYKVKFVTENGKEGRYYAEVYEPKPLSSYGTEVEIKIDFAIDGETGVTGGGEAIRIFSTVSKITLEVYDTTRARNPNDIIILKFTAHGASRKKLYAKLAQGLARMRGGIIVRGSPDDASFVIDFDPPKTAAFVARQIVIEPMTSAHPYKVLRPASGRELVDYLSTLDLYGRWLLDDNGKIYVWDGMSQIHAGAVTDLGLESAVGGHMIVQKSNDSPAALYVGWQYWKYGTLEEESHGKVKKEQAYDPLTVPSFYRLMASVPIPIEPMKRTGMVTFTREQLDKLQPQYAYA